MRTTKLITLTALMTALCFISVIYTSCKNDKVCKDLACVNGGSCNDGKCVCPAGYGGTLCETLWSNKFVYVWNINYKYTTGGSNSDENFISSILSTQVPTSLIINDFFGYGYADNVIMEMTSPTTFVFKENQLLLEDVRDKMFLTSGDGSIDELGITITGSFNIKYVRSDNRTDEYTVTYTAKKM